MTETPVDVCVPVDISDDDIYDAMKSIAGYLDITPGDFKEVYVKAYQYAMLRLTRSVKAADVMTGNVTSVSDSTPLTEVAEIMARRKISGVPVVSAEGRVEGVISEQDFLSVMGGGQASGFMEVVAQCLSGGACLAAPLTAQCAGDLMSSPAVTVGEQTPILEVADIMTRKKVNRVPVVNEDGRLIGIVSRADVVRSSFSGGGAS
jgi:CBS domain-containing membrane protein